MKITLEADWIKTITKNTYREHVFFQDYMCPPPLKHIARDGIFLNGWNFFNNTKHEIYHKSLATLLPLPSGSVVFRHFGTKNSKPKTKLLLMLLMDPWISPVYMLEDSLIHLKKRIDVNSLEIFCLLEAHSPFSPAKHLNYINSFYKTLQHHLGYVPKFLDSFSVFKMNSLSEWSIYEAGTPWFCTDNYISHLALSKGATYIPYCEDLKFLKKSEYRLSRNHGIELGQIEDLPTPKSFDVFNLLKDDELAQVCYSELQVPDVFMSAFYKAL